MSDHYYQSVLSNVRQYNIEVHEKFEHKYPKTQSGQRHVQTLTQSETPALQEVSNQ